MEHFKVVVQSYPDKFEEELNLAFKQGYRLHSYKMINDTTSFIDGFFYSAVLELEGE